LGAQRPVKTGPQPDTPAPPPPVYQRRIAGWTADFAHSGKQQYLRDKLPYNNLLLIFQRSWAATPGTRYQATSWKDERRYPDRGASPTCTARTLPLVRAVNADDVVSETPASLTAFCRRSPTLVVPHVAALLIVGAVIALDRYRVARARIVGRSFSLTNLTERLALKGDELGKAHQALALDYDVTASAESASPGEASPKFSRLFATPRMGRRRALVCR
jgi:hypothetical protein